MDATPSASAPKRIFISYTHEQSAHDERVRSLAVRLHEEGFDIEIDVFRQDQAETWELWMRKAVGRSDYVLVICTKLYRERFEHQKGDGKGLGAKWEGALISQALYEAESLNRKFIPVVFTASDLDHRPDVLRGATYYVLDSAANFLTLLRYLLGRPEFVLGPRGTPRSFTSRSPEPLRFSDELSPLVASPSPSAPDVADVASVTQAVTAAPIPADGATQLLSSPLPSPSPGPQAALGGHVTPASFDPAKRYIHIPFSKKGDQVIGRGAELDAVRAQLANGRPTSIGQTAAFHGLGGLGKTQLAIEYGYAYADDYSGGVYWFNADQDIEVQLTELAVAAGWVSPLSEHKDKLDLARHQIRSRAGTLLIFDNVEDRAAIDAFLPAPAVRAHLLITSRLPIPGFSEVPLTLLEEDQALAMLFSESGQSAVGADEEGSAREIIRALDRLPLAIELAGAYLRYRPIGWAAYLERLQAAPREALPGKFLDSFTRHEADLFKTLRVSDEIIAEEPLLRSVLDLLTWSGTAPMGLSLMSAILKPGTETELMPALAHGVKLKLLQRTPGTQRFALHRLVREVRREEVPLAKLEPPQPEATARLASWFEAHREDFAHLAVYEAEIDHLKAWEGHARVSAPVEAARLLWLQGYPAFHRVDGAGVTSIMARALALLPAGTTGHEPLKAHLLNDQGWGEGTSGNNRAARRLFEESYALRLEHLGDQHVETAASMENVARALASEVAELPRALDLAERALVIRKAAFGLTHPKTAEALSALGFVNRTIGDPGAARHSEEEALSICQKHFGERHPRTADANGRRTRRTRTNIFRPSRGRTCVPASPNEL
jgi:hypothetical protein